MAPVVKNPPDDAEDEFNPWDGKIPLEKEMEMHSSILAWETQWTEGPGRLD